MSTKRKYTQYSREEKLDAISKILSGARGITETSRLINVASSSIKLWVSKFKLYGEASLERRYSVNNRDFKLSVIMDIVNNGLSLSEASLKYNLSTYAISSWRSKIEDQGISGLDSKIKGRKAKVMKTTEPHKNVSKRSQTDLEKELEYLRAENAYLKKLAALVQEKRSQKNGKKSK